MHHIARAFKGKARQVRRIAQGLHEGYARAGRRARDMGRESDG
ncbi:hypothetical protein AADZ90_010645 [Aestuariibius sp. 2305UL40-4]